MRYSINSTQYEVIREWLKKQRHEADLSIRALASKLGVHHSVVGKIEDGRRKIDLLEFVDYCEALDIDPHIGINLILESIKYPKKHTPFK
ncbi:helix-turn-helix domain-containing protein [Pleionea sp. CnH1-48]|uniref:helix-turn-helix domain-containing protein n=1 Tax=Pleionea sp. CnH1-48 TaxID=2954494 RepID=UPI0020982F4A|nr:helix-turn-helix transcriptional regulator [Pleionea sp. CnH1-48]MCO7226639.1 helix-turn-helix transcriptional regulator [Pleionea sp. CnH1-48]